MTDARSVAVNGASRGSRGTLLLIAAVLAHLGAGVALAVMLSGDLGYVLVTAHQLGLERLLRVMLVCCALVPRLTVLPAAVVVWRRGGARRWFAYGCAAVAAESVARAVVAVGSAAPATLASWAARLRPPVPTVSAALTLGIAGGCWATALAVKSAESRGWARAPDWQDRREAFQVAVGWLAGPVALVALLSALG